MHQLARSQGVVPLPSPLCPQVCCFAIPRRLHQAGVSPGPLACTRQVVSFECIGPDLVLVAGLPLGVVQGAVLQLAPAQMGMEPNFVVQVQVRVPVRRISIIASSRL